MHEFRPDFVFIFLSAKIFTAFVTSFFQAVKKSKEMSMSYQKRLDQAFENVPVLPLDDNHKARGIPSATAASAIASININT